MRLALLFEMGVDLKNCLDAHWVGASLVIDVPCRAAMLVEIIFVELKEPHVRDPEHSLVNRLWPDEFDFVRTGDDNCDSFAPAGFEFG